MSEQGSYSVIITAGGIGKRMQSSVPKQFMLVKGKPLLMYTLERFYHFNSKFQLILTLPADWFNYWESLMDEFDFKIPHRIVEGGTERYHSIKNALEYCRGKYVAVHDGVRPLVDEETLKNCFFGIKKCDALIPVVSLKDSIRRKVDDGSIALNRSDYLIVQTPQCFRKEVILDAYNRPFHDQITDDASLVEEAGYSITVVDGNDENVKVTTQADLKFAELFLK